MASVWLSQGHIMMEAPAGSLWLLVDPVKLGRLPADDIALTEPESDLLLGVLNAVGSMADIAADIYRIVPTDGAGGGSEGVGGTEDG